MSIKKWKKFPGMFQHNTVILSSDLRMYMFIFFAFLLKQTSLMKEWPIKPCTQCTQQLMLAGANWVLWRKRWILNVMVHFQSTCCSWYLPTKYILIKCIPFFLLLFLFFAKYVGHSKSNAWTSSHWQQPSSCDQWTNPLST